MPDADGYPLNLNHWGKVHNSKATPELIDKGDYLIADKSYDSHSIRDKAREHGMKPVIPKRKNLRNSIMTLIAICINYGIW